MPQGANEAKATVKAAIITGVCALLVGIIGTFAVTSITNNNQIVSVYINGTEVKVNPDEYQSMYADLERQNNQLKTENESLLQKTEEEYNRGFEAGKQSVTLPIEPRTEQTTEAPITIIETDLFSGEIKLVDSDNWKVNEGELADSLGNIYLSTYYAIGGNRAWVVEGYAVYNVKELYKKLTGTIAPHESTGSNNEGYLKIYADDKLIYQSPKITRSTYPIPLELELPKNTKILKFVVPAGGGTLLLTDFALS